MKLEIKKERREMKVEEKRKVETEVVDRMKEIEKKMEREERQEKRMIIKGKGEGWNIIFWNVAG